MDISKWLGLRNTVAAERLKPGELQVALDVDVDDSFAIHSRRGQTQVNAAVSHSLWAKGDMCLVAQGQDLKRMDSAGALTQLKRLQYAGPISYAEYNGVVYFSNGVDTGRVVQGAVKEWGIRVPTGQPAALATTYGTMAPGRYMYAVTFARADGLESGSRHPEVIELPVAGGITFSGLPTSSDPDVVARVLYLTGPNGTELYRHTAVSSASADPVYVTDVRLYSTPLPADYVEPAPAGAVLAVHAGTAYVADGSVIWISDQYSLERFRRGRRFIPMPGPVAVIAPVEHGMYVATDAGTWYFQGDDPERMSSRQILTYGAVPGTFAPYDLAQEAEEGQDPQPSELAALWVSPNGVIMGGPGGQARNLTEENFSFPPGQRGAAMVRTARGYASYIATLQGTGTAPNAH